MVDISKEEMNAALGSPSIAVGGLAAGFDIHYGVEGNTSLNGPVPSATLKLDEASLERAEQRSGVSHTSSHPIQDAGVKNALSLADKQEEKADNLYANSFSKKMESKVERGTSFTTTFSSSRRDHRTAMCQSASPKNLLMRVQDRRQLHRLRKTFEDISAQNTKPMPVSPESLPKSVLKRVAEEAISKGAQMTPIGSLVKVAKMAGCENPWEKWGSALIPGSYIGVMAPRPRSS